MLIFEQLAIGYPGAPPVLEEVDLALGRGFWLVTGRSGSGKSSLLRCAASLIRPRTGRILWQGRDVWADPLAFRWHLGFAPQEELELPGTSVRDYLSYLAAIKGIRTAYQAGRVAELMGMFSLPDQPVNTCSTGIRRRLALAAALLSDPNLLILDEPTVGLDLEERLRLRMLLSDLATERVILVATHIPEEMEGISDGRLHLDGRKVTVHANSY